MTSKKTTKNIHCLVYLERTGITIYSSTLSDVAKFAFPDTVVRDLEIIDLKTLNSQLASFLTQLALPVGEASIILAQSCYFVQEIVTKSSVTKNEVENGKLPMAATNQNNQTEIDHQKATADQFLEETQRQNFVKAIPFADVFSSIITVNKHRYIIALNREFYDPIVKILEAHHLKVIRIIPDLALLNMGEEGLSIANGNSLLGSVGKNTESNLIMKAPVLEIGSMQVAPAKGSPERKRTIAMVVGFAVLILVFLFLFFRMYSENQADKTKLAAAKLAKQEEIAAATAKLTLTPTPSPTSPLPNDQLATSPAQLASQVAQLKVVILNGSGQAGQAAIVQNKLTTLGFTLSETGNASTVLSGNTLVVLKPNVSQAIRQLLVTTLTDFGLTPLTTESSELVEDIRITTGSIIANP